jgi:hypothetical protein
MAHTAPIRRCNKLVTTYLNWKVKIGERTGTGQLNVSLNSVGDLEPGVLDYKIHVVLVV